MALRVLLLIAMLATVSAGAKGLHEIPLPAVEQADGAIDQRIRTERWTMRIRNLHKFPMVAFTLRLIDPERPTAKHHSSSDRVMNPRRAIHLGESVDHATYASCSVVVVVVASVFEDGTFAGSNDEVEAVFRRRQARLRTLREALSVLQSTSVGETGVSRAAELQTLLESLAGSRDVLVGMDAVSAMENRPDIFNAMKKEHLSKDMLIQSLELGVSILDRSVVPRRLPD
jgi:hypothetical protein